MPRKGHNLLFTSVTTATVFKLQAIQMEQMQLLVASISSPLREVTIETVTAETIKGNKNGRGRERRSFENLK